MMPRQLGNVPYETGPIFQLNYKRNFYVETFMLFNSFLCVYRIGYIEIF